MRIRYLQGFIWVFLIANIVSADEIWLKDGTHLVGSVESYSDKQVKIKTKLIGSITVKLDDISGITTDKPYSISLGPDDENVASFVFKDETQTIVGDSGESSPIELSEIELVWPAHEPRPKPKYWSGSSEVSVIGENADTNDILFVTRSRAIRDRDLDKLLLDLRFKYEMEDDSTTEYEYNFLGRYDWDRPEGILHNFVELEAEHDRFDELDLRLIITGGVARDIIKQENKNFTVRGGLGWYYERFKDDTDNSDPVGELGYNIDRTFWDYLKIEDDVRFDILLTDLSDYRVYHEFAGLMPLVKTKDWQLKFGMINEYLSDTSGEQSNWETDYTLSLVYSW